MKLPPSINRIYYKEYSFTGKVSYLKPFVLIDDITNGKSYQLLLDTLLIFTEDFFVVNSDKLLNITGKFKANSDNHERGCLIDIINLREIDTEEINYKDPALSGIPNINFTCIKQDDDRWDKYQKQRFKRGFDDSETWSLDCTIASFISPRFNRYLEITEGMFVEDSQAKNDKKIIKRCFELLSTGKISFEKEEEREIIKNGLKLFGEYFRRFSW